MPKRNKQINPNAELYTSAVMIINTEENLNVDEKTSKS